MKYIECCLLVACCHCCFGQPATNFLVTGDWSDFVRDDAGYAVGGRLLIGDSSSTNKSGRSGNVKVYVELCHFDEGFHGLPIEIYVEDLNCLRFELRDGSGERIRPKKASEIFQISRGVEAAYRLTIPCDSTVRLRADYNLRGEKKPGEFDVTVPGVFWRIRREATNDFFLSGTFSPPTNTVSGGCHGWNGTLELPKVRIPVEKLRKPPA
jgi:hypothetical protein